MGKYAQINDGLEYSSMKAALGSGYAFASSIIPLVNEADPPAAQVIKENMYFKSLNGNSPVYQGANAVYRAFADAVQKMDTMECPMIGGIGMDLCTFLFTPNTPDVGSVSVTDDVKP